MGANDEVERNFNAFQAALPRLLHEHAGKYALLHDAGVVDFFDSAMQAFTRGYTNFGEANFSVQQVTEAVEDLGFYSYVGRTGHA